MNSMVDVSDYERERQRQVELDARRYKEAVIWLMSDKRGRLFVYRLLESCGVYRISYVGNADTNFREGERNQGLKLMSTVEECCPGSYVMMLKENRLSGTSQGGDKRRNTDG